MARAEVNVGVRFYMLDAEEADLVEKHREEKRRKTILRGAARAEAENLRARLSGHVWTTREGEEIPVRKMTPRHAGNAVRFALGIDHRFREANRRAKDPRDPLPPVPAPSSARNWPLVRALELRAEEGPSLRDRLVEARNRRRYERSRK